MSKVTKTGLKGLAKGSPTGNTYGKGLKAQVVAKSIRQSPSAPKSGRVFK